MKNSDIKEALLSIVSLIDFQESLEEERYEGTTRWRYADTDSPVQLEPGKFRSRPIRQVYMICVSSKFELVRTDSEDSLIHSKWELVVDGKPVVRYRTPPWLHEAYQDVLRVVRGEIGF